jgi:hypothetical protein
VTLDDQGQRQRQRHVHNLPNIFDDVWENANGKDDFKHNQTITISSREPTIYNQKWGYRTMLYRPSIYEL